ncbi:hypothetical protein ABH904_003741 [Pseudomonas frederiksbergensis]
MLSSCHEKIAACGSSYSYVYAAMSRVYSVGVGAAEGCDLLMLIRAETPQ